MTGKQNRFAQNLDADGEHPLLDSYVSKKRVALKGPMPEGGPATAAYADQAASAGHAATARRMVENAHGAKVRATEAWVNGDMSSQQHAEVHKRADRVIKSKGALALRTDRAGDAAKAKGARVAGGMAGHVKNAKSEGPRGDSRAAVRRTNAAGRKQQGRY
jgi:hypothetical protein